MATVTLYGHDTVLGGDSEEQQLRVQVMAMKCERPHYILLRFGDNVYNIDQATLERAKLHLSKKVSLGKIMEALKLEDQMLPFSPQEPVDTRMRVERVLRVLDQQNPS